MKYLYRLNYPEKWDQNTPVAISLHGMGTDYNDLQPVMDQIAKNEIQLSLQGDLKFQNGYEFFAPSFDRGSDKEVQVIGTVLKNVYAFVQNLLQDKGLTSNPLHYLGFSQGAIIGAGLTVFHPNLFREVELFSGRLPLFVEQAAEEKLPAKLKQPQIFISQGLLDPLFGPEVGRHLADVLADHFSNVHYHEYQVGHGIVQNTLTDVLKENKFY